MRTTRVSHCYREVRNLISEDDLTKGIASEMSPLAASGMANIIPIVDDGSPKVCASPHTRAKATHASTNGSFRVSNQGRT